MPIKFLPDQLLKKIAPAKKIERMVTDNLSLKKTALRFIDSVEYIDKGRVTEVALKTIKGYQSRVQKADELAGIEDVNAGNALASEIVDSPRLLINRVQNEVIFQVHELIKEKYAGEKARWLPSDADEPRPEHQANYGKTYTIGEGINGVEPGDDPGCKCGVEILVNETELKLG